MTKLLYEKVRIDLQAKIENEDFPIGYKLASENELAEEYNVSLITIKRALNDLKEAGYLSRKPRQGTIVISNTLIDSSADIKNSKLLIGAIFTNYTDIFGTQILNGIIENHVNDTNIIVKKSLGNVKEEERLIKEMMEQQVDGLILLPATSKFLSPAILDLASNDFPLVVIDRTLENLPISAVTTDNINSSSYLTDYLVSLGHENVGMITSTNLVSSVNDRIQGYIQAHASNKLVLDESNINRLVQSVIPNNITSPKEDIEKISDFLRKHPHLTAIIASEFNIAVLIEQACQSNGLRVPEDISIACFDHPEHYFESSVPRFTHIKQKQFEMGQQSLDLLIKHIQGDSEVHKSLITGELVLGKSTSKLKN